MKANPHTLPPFLERNLAQIQEICHAHKVKRLWVFGSILRTDFHAGSDVDLLYELEEELISDEEYLTNFDSLHSKLITLLKRKVDFVHYPSLKNPYFITEIEETKALLYAKEPQKVSI